MTSLAKMKNNMGKAMTTGPRALEESELPNAVPRRQSLPAQIDMIVVEDRFRSVDPAAVDHMAESMEQQGQIYPVQIRTIEPGRFRLVAGAHRIAAAQKLGWTVIEAFLVDDMDDEEVSLLEIDENLCRAELKPLDRCRFLARRKNIYERLHPETKHGAHLMWPRGPHRKTDPQPSTERAPSFVENTAASTPWAPRTIRRSTRIGERISPDLQSALADTPIARRTRDLESIADMKPEKQQELLQHLQDAEQPPPSLSALMRERNPTPSAPDYFKRMKTLWNKAPQADQHRFSAWLEQQQDKQR